MRGLNWHQNSLIIMLFSFYRLVDLPLESELGQPSSLGHYYPCVISLGKRGTQCLLYYFLLLSKTSKGHKKIVEKADALLTPFYWFNLNSQFILSFGHSFFLNNDQSQFSPNNFHSSSREKVTRIHCHNDHQSELMWSLYQILATNLWKNALKSIWRISMWILRHKGQIFCTCA